MNHSMIVLLPEEAENLNISYTKVAERQELTENQVGEFLEKETEHTECVTVEQGGEVKIANLEEGVYRLEVTEGTGYTFSPLLVSVPMWNEETQKMTTEVTVTPKYTRPVLNTEIRQTTAPQTGDEGQGTFFGVFGAISLIIVVIITCHNRFKCGRMSHK